mmetsp:Transcript_3605/g.9934  ORF Transcript_3605/g.9934 Transcript_3605/m.9934 type:complete len:226 (-) Transcript_3605:1311-1988(-)
MYVPWIEKPQNLSPTVRRGNWHADPLLSRRPSAFGATTRNNPNIGLPILPVRTMMESGTTEISWKLLDQWERLAVLSFTGDPIRHSIPGVFELARPKFIDLQRAWRRWKIPSLLVNRSKRVNEAMFVSSFLSNWLTKLLWTTSWRRRSRRKSGKGHRTLTFLLASSKCKRFRIHEAVRRSRWPSANSWRELNPRTLEHYWTPLHLTNTEPWQKLGFNEYAARSLC